MSSLYTNIPIAQGIEIYKLFLETMLDKSVPTSFLITLLTLVLTCNILLQCIGTAMDTRVAPTFACFFNRTYVSEGMERHSTTPL